MKRAGFTLCETVVALSLFALAAVTLSQAALNARLGLARLDRQEPWRQHVISIRRQVLAITDRAVLEEGGEIELAPSVRKNPRDGDEDLQTADPIRARWEAEIEPTSLLDVHRLTISVTFDHVDGLSGEHVESCFVYRPGWYEREDRSTLFEDKQEQWERRRLERGL